MTIHVGIGFDQKNNIEEAAQQAALKAKSQLSTPDVDQVIVFSTINYPAEKTVPVIESVFQTNKIIGCSTAGLILADSIETNGVGVLAMQSEKLETGIGSVESIQAKDSQQIGTVLAQRSLVDFGRFTRQLFVFFIDGTTQNNTPLIKGVQEVLGNMFPVVGAGSTDAFHFTDSFQIYQNKVFHHSAVGLLLGGHITIGIGARHGWRPLGKPRFVDQSSGNIIRTINGNKAAFLYEEFFGEFVKDLYTTKLGHSAILYPLGIKVEGTNHYLIRNAVEFLSDGSIVCQGDIPEGAEVHIMIGNKDACVDASLEAAQEAKKALGGKKAQLLLIIESMARLKLLGRSTYEEIKLIRRVFGQDVPLFGMYSNGEVYPFQALESYKKPFLQNESIVIIAIS